MQRREARRRPASQMYQISANPQTVASPARITPAPVFFGMWIGRNPSSGPVVAALLHVPPGIAVVHDRREGEVVGRRRRGGGPFERPGAPRVAGEVAQLVAPQIADRELDEERQAMPQAMSTAPIAAIRNQICSVRVVENAAVRRVTPIRPRM